MPVAGCQEVAQLHPPRSLRPVSCVRVYPLALYTLDWASGSSQVALRTALRRPSLLRRILKLALCLLGGFA
jgi:hypothetical protein